MGTRRGHTGMPLVSRMRPGTCRADRPERMASWMRFTRSGRKLCPEAIFRKRTTLSSPSLLCWGTQRLSATSSKASTAEKRDGRAPGARPQPVRLRGAEREAGLPSHAPGTGARGGGQVEGHPHWGDGGVSLSWRFCRGPQAALPAQVNLKIRRKREPVAGLVGGAKAGKRPRLLQQPGCTQPGQGCS